MSTSLFLAAAHPSGVGYEGGVPYGAHFGHFLPLNPTTGTQSNEDSAFISLLDHIPVQV